MPIFSERLLFTAQLERCHPRCSEENPELLFCPHKNQAQVPDQHFTSTNEFPAGVLIACSAINALSLQTLLQNSLTITKTRHVVFHLALPRT